MATLIIPAILESRVEDFQVKTAQLQSFPGASRIQVDFCDGQFVATKSLAVGDLPALDQKLHWEAHLMVQEPKNFQDYQAAGFQTVIIHYEAFATEELVDKAATEIKKLGLEPGLAINPETPISALRYFGGTIKHFTLLSVHPGQQGSAFLPEAVDRLRELRAILPHAILEVDGGIDFETARVLASAGADELVVGSALWRNEAARANWGQLKQI